VATTIDRDVSASVAPEPDAPPAPQAGGSGAEVPVAPEASVRPQEAADAEGPHLSGSDIAAFEAEMK
jgi:hypothetical protein